ncbi:MAG: elongation factor P [Candidatus Levybacteria bacterium]|nr:elongation factor P [Candidatus Levybacteria bacterium]
MISVTDLKSGIAYEEEGNILQVISYEHIKMGRGSANIKVKVRNLTTGAILEKSYINGANVKDIYLESRQLQFLYKDDERAYFMDPRSYEQVDVSLKNLAGHEFLLEGNEAIVQMNNGEALSLLLPPKVTLKVTDTAPGVKGNSASNVYKDATVENGMKVRVPLFINTGDSVVVDTRDGSYTKRA